LRKILQALILQALLRDDDAASIIGRARLKSS
jgi:hypothetical protein